MAKNLRGILDPSTSAYDTSIVTEALTGITDDAKGADFVKGTVEVTPGGAQTFKTLIPNGAGDLFGLAVKPGANAIYFVNDGNNTLELFH